MAFSRLQPSFTGGEVSPSLQVRVDSPVYHSWLKNACNFFVHPQGGVSNRPGTAFMGQAKYNDKACRLIPFVISEEESYVLEVGHQYLRVYTPAGRVLAAELTPYELETPYQQAELPQIQYAQYGHTLFWAHPNHPPRRLVRTEPGRFVWEEIPLHGGPFQVANTQSGRRLRVVQYVETSNTQGVAASVSFQPAVDPNYFVQAYFQGALFFTGHGYGLDIDFLVSEFNRVYNPAGCQAYNLGGVVKIVSPEAAGGDWNGTEFVLEYRNSFVRPAVYTLVQTLSGGVNQGELIEQGGDKFLLESNFDLFTPQQVGGLFSITHPIENPYQSGTLGYDGASAPLKTGSDWKLRLGGNWTGQIVLEKSTDLGVSWQTYQTFSRVDGDGAISTFGNLEDTGGLYYLRLRGLNIAGEAGFELSAEPFVQEGIVRVADYINARQVTVQVEQAFGSAEWSSVWAEGSFSEKNGYPACVFFFQDRFGLAATREEGQTVWFSKTADYTHFGHSRGTLADDDSMSIHLSGKQLSTIRSVAVAGRLFVFTSGGEWTIFSQGAFTPSTVQLQQQSQLGAGYIAPLFVGSRLLFVQARGGVLRDYYYDDSSASYTGSDLTLLAKHLFFNRQIREMCYQQEPDHLIWCVLSNGELACLTYLAQQNVCAWTHHNTQGKFASICTLPANGYDEVWLAVERNGKWLVEKMLPRLASKAPEEQVFLDASVSRREDTPFEEVSGLAHLEGMSVDVLADGNPLAACVVSGGKITLPHPVYCAHAGLKYTAQLESLPMVFPQEQGGLASPKQRLTAVTLYLLDSRGGQAAMTGQTPQTLLQRTAEPFNTPLPLKTEAYSLTLSGQHVSRPTLFLQQTEPLPITLLAVLCRFA